MVDHGIDDKGHVQEAEDAKVIGDARTYLSPEEDQRILRKLDLWQVQQENLWPMKLEI